MLEANILGIPVYGICDSNADPDLFTSFVPANDDAVKSLYLLLTTIEDAMLQGSSAKAAKLEAMAKA